MESYYSSKGKPGGFVWVQLNGKKGGKKNHKAEGKMIVPAGGGYF